MGTTVSTSSSRDSSALRYWPLHGKGRPGWGEFPGGNGRNEEPYSCGRALPSLGMEVSPGRRSSGKSSILGGCLRSSPVCPSESLALTQRRCPLQFVGRWFSDSSLWNIYISWLTPAVFVTEIFSVMWRLLGSLTAFLQVREILILPVRMFFINLLQLKQHVLELNEKADTAIKLSPTRQILSVLKKNVQQSHSSHS